jgi:hypothetical protein
VLAVSIQLGEATGTGYTQPSGLVGYWNFDQGSGAIAYDSSGFNNQGIIYGASWTTGKVNEALNFDGLNDYVDCGNNEPSTRHKELPSKHGLFLINYPLLQTI